MKELTRQQQAVYDFVKSYIEKKSYPPTIREIGAAVGLSFNLYRPFTRQDAYR